MADTPILRVRDLSVTFSVGKGKTFTAVDKVSFDLDKGETLALVGESGSGKSTVALSIMGLFDPGSARVDGRIRLRRKNGDHAELTRLPEREMRALQQRLQDALANNATDEEIERLIKELQEAINRYLQAMLENMQRNPEQMRQPMDRNAMRMEMRDLQKMLDQARQLARTGARDAARDLLAKLQDMLENLRAGQPMMGQQQGGSSEAQQMMQGLQDLIQRQQNLLDRTFRRSQQGRPGQRGQQPGQRGQPGQQGQPGQPGDGDGDGDGGADSAEQAELRRQLGELMRQLGEMMGNIPGGFGRAERSMRDSGDALERGAPGRALRPQMDALDQLRAAGRDLAQQMMEQFGQGDGEGEGWLLTYLHDRDGGPSRFAVFDATRLEKGPVAQVRLPTRVPWLNWQRCWSPQRIRCCSRCSVSPESTLQKEAPKQSL